MGEQTDPVTGARDGLLARARRSSTVPKFFHLLTNSEYFNRAGSLVHTDVTGDTGRGSAGHEPHLPDRVGAAHRRDRFRRRPSPIRTSSGKRT